MMRIHRTYVHRSDVRYGESGSANLLDVWRRPDLTAVGGAPVLLQIPGGAWTLGNKQGQGHPLLSHMVDRGWVCVSINYRLGPRNVWPAQIVDVKRALAWVKANIADHGGDPGFVAVTGGSAGGHLSALAALTPGDPAFQPGFEDADTSVAAAVPLYGVYDWTDRDGTAHDLLARHLEGKVVQARMTDDPAPFESASPTGRVGPQAPPFFVVHGRNDSYVPVEQARSFVRALRSASREPVVYAELPFAQHAFDVFGSVRAERTADAVASFLSAVRSRRAGSER
jgi:acetyl esterase/lipase